MTYTQQRRTDRDRQTKQNKPSDEQKSPVKGEGFFFFFFFFLLQKRPPSSIVDIFNTGLIVTTPNKETRGLCMPSRSVLMFAMTSPSLFGSRGKGRGKEERHFKRL